MLGWHACRTKLPLIFFLGVSDIFFSARGGEAGLRGAGSRFCIENPRGGGLQGERGRGAGSVCSELANLGGGVLIFFFGAEMSKFSRARKPWSANCELKHWNFWGWKCLIHGLHFTVNAPPQFTVCAPFWPLIHGSCAFFRPLLTPLSTAPSLPQSQFTVCTSRFARSRFLIRHEKRFEKREKRPKTIRNVTDNFKAPSHAAQTFLIGTFLKVFRRPKSAQLFYFFTARLCRGSHAMTTKSSRSTEQKNEEKGQSPSNPIHTNPWRNLPKPSMGKSGWSNRALVEAILEAPKCHLWI